MDSENLSTIVGYLLRVCPIVAIGTKGTELALYQPYALVPYENHQMISYEMHNAVEERRKRIEDALRYGIRFDYKGMKEKAQGQQDTQGVTAIVQEMYTDLETAIEEGEYEEVEMHAESLMGIARSTIETNPLLKGLLR